MLVGASDTEGGFALGERRGAYIFIGIVARGLAPGRSYPVRIHETSDCNSPAWALGGELGALEAGDSGDGALNNATHLEWTVGSGGGTDLVGRALALHDPVSGAAIACGVLLPT
jgi:hypothetical protein